MSAINILAVSNGVGITRDVDILSEVLTKAGHEVVSNHTFRYKPTRKYDLNIFLERFKPELFEWAEKNVIIPNQEWFETGWLPVLPAFDAVFTKTIFATDVFKQLGSHTEFISFTSDDRYLPDIKKDYYHYIHIAGKSIQKQTDIVVKAWERNPGFPQLTIVQDPKFYRPRSSSRNINYLTDRVPEQLLKVMQNTNAVHICPSETEGFGHYIVEAMSCKSVVMTTLAPPMTELVIPSRGCFVQSIKQEPMRLSFKFIISPETLEKAVIELLITDDVVLQQKGEKAREFFLENDAFFRSRIVEAVANTLS